jgi:uncharacterized RDD family membrane protein YckC
MDYLTLSVTLQALDREAHYEATVRGPVGDGRAQFELPFSEQDLQAITAAVSRPRSSRRRIETEESAQAREFGKGLFDLVFQGRARDALISSLAHAQSVEDRGLRVMLQLDGAPALRNVPWELLWDRPDFMSISAYTPVLRYVDPSQRRPPVEVPHPLRILGMVSSPGDAAPLDVEGEKEQLESACERLKGSGLLEIEWVDEANLSGLLDCLKSGTRYHIFHFMGHGDFDEQAEDGVLLFEGQAGRSQRVPGARLGTIMRDHHTLRLAIINACEGARIANDSSGVASSLMESGLPAVIAMQFEISDVAAISFARCFYGSLARGNAIDTALADARLGMFADNHALEWATPVMFTSVDDGRLFKLQTTPAEAQASARRLPPPAPPDSDAKSVKPAATEHTPRPPESAPGAARAPRVPVVEPDSPPQGVAKGSRVGRESWPVYAGFWPRFWASMIDGFIAFFIFAIVGGIVDGGNKSNESIAVVVALIVALLYYIGSEGRWGRTVGKRALGLRVVDAKVGGPIGYWRALIRVFGRYLSSIPLCAGYLVMINDSRKQCWHDKLARTVVISAQRT